MRNKENGMELLKEDGCIGEKAFHGKRSAFPAILQRGEKRGSGEREALFRLKDKNGNYYNMDQLAAKRKKKDGSLRSTDGVFGSLRRIPELRAYGLKRININLSPEVCEVPETVPNIMQILRKYEVSEVRSAWRSPRCARSGMQRISAAWWNS